MELLRFCKKVLAGISTEEASTITNIILRLVLAI